MMDPHVVWHDVECGAYTVDLPLWGELAANARHGVLDVGAGTGRVAIPLACNGHKVIALDNDPVLLAELERRADGLGIDTLLADATDFAVPAPVSLIVVPMQTIQLLPDRSGFFASARRSLTPGGRVAVAIATGLEAFDGAAALPFPDLGEAGGYRFISQPVAIRFLTADPGPLPTGSVTRVGALGPVLSPHGVVDAETYLSPGTVVVPVRTGDDRHGYVVATGPTTVEALESADHAAALLVVEVE